MSAVREYYSVIIGTYENDECGAGSKKKITSDTSQPPPPTRTGGVPPPPGGLDKVTGT